MPTQRELAEMEQDYLQMEREQVEQICREFMKDELFEGMVAKEELRLMREGHTIVVPHDVEHARAMFKMACFYLGQYDKEFTLRME
jgi:mannitol/fructose-specific phosphotransferase system IIA component